MKRLATALLPVIGAFTCVAVFAAAATPAGPGWTGLTKPKDVILARAELMEHMEEAMR